MQKKTIGALLLVLCLMIGAVAGMAEPPVQTKGITIPVIENMKQFDIPDNDAMKLMRDMKSGWNLGNTFDAIDGFEKKGKKAHKFE